MRSELVAADPKRVVEIERQDQGPGLGELGLGTDRGGLGVGRGRVVGLDVLGVPDRLDA
jgi:hypothetical protein